jgi:hypothetical protein
MVVAKKKAIEPQSAVGTLKGSMARWVRSDCPGPCTAVLMGSPTGTGKGSLMHKLWEHAVGFGKNRLNSSIELVFAHLATVSRGAHTAAPSRFMLNLKAPPHRPALVIYGRTVPAYPGYTVPGSLPQICLVCLQVAENFDSTVA